MNVKSTKRFYEIEPKQSEIVSEEVNQIEVVTSLMPNGKMKFVLYAKGFSKHTNGTFGVHSGIINLPQDVAFSICVEILESIMVSGVR